MRFVALIMAGGKGTRFGRDTEKPMALFNGKPLIRHVIKAVKEAERINEIYVAVTTYCPVTAIEATKVSVNIIETDGQGYHADVRQAIKDTNLNCRVMIISSDLPLLNGKFLDEIIDRYEKSGKPALTVLIPEKAFNKYGLSTVSPYEHQGIMYAVSGINIIDGCRILEEQEQEVVISDKPEAVFSLNSFNDLSVARKYINQINGESKRNKD